MADASKYQVIINMSDASANTLKDQGYSLYTLKGVRGPRNGAPVVWFRTGNYGRTTSIRWGEEYRVFTARSTDIGPDTVVAVENDYDAELGSLLTVNSATGTGTLTSGGPAGAISVLNDTSMQINCGLSQRREDGTYSPLAVFPMLGESEVEMVPVETVFLMFASDTVDTGTVVEKAFTSGIAIDLTGAPADADGRITRTVAFDVNTGWDDGGAPWDKVLPPNTNLVPLLIGGRAPGGM